MKSASPRLVELLRDEDIQELISVGDWKKLYVLVPARIRSELTQLLYEAGLDPLENQIKIPRAFLYEADIKSFKIPQHITSIDDYAFSYCSSLTSISIGNGVTGIGGMAFEDCSSLEGVYITDIAAWCAIDFSSRTSNPLYNECSLYLNGQPVTDLIIPAGVTSISAWAFYGCSSLESVIIPGSVTSIGYEALYKCDNLKEITYKGTVAQWRKVKKAGAFNNNIIVHCSNGDLQLQGKTWAKV